MCAAVTTINNNSAHLLFFASLCKKATSNNAMEEMIARPVDIYVNRSNNNNEYNSRYTIGFPDENTLDISC